MPSSPDAEEAIEALKTTLQFLQQHVLSKGHHPFIKIGGKKASKRDPDKMEFRIVDKECQIPSRPAKSAKLSKINGPVVPRNKLGKCSINQATQRSAVTTTPLKKGNGGVSAAMLEDPTTAAAPKEISLSACDTEVSSATVGDLAKKPATAGVAVAPSAKRARQKMLLKSGGSVCLPPSHDIDFDAITAKLQHGAFKIKDNCSGDFQFGSRKHAYIELTPPTSLSFTAKNGFHGTITTNGDTLRDLLILHPMVN